MSAPSARLPLFNSLRAIAALTLLAFHAGTSAGLTGGTRLETVVSRLDSGVWVFFVISGTLLYRPFVAARLRGGPAPSIGFYATRRVLRIVPAYWVALTVISIWVASPGLFTPTGIPRYYGFAQIYSERTALLGSGLGQAWSLCVEAVFYLFLPIYALGLRALPARTPRARLLTEVGGLAALIMVSLAWKVVVLAGIETPTVGTHVELFLLPAYLDLFALGMGLGLLTVLYPDGARLPRGLRLLDHRPAIAWLASLVAFAILCYGVGARGYTLFSPTDYFERDILAAIMAVGVVLPAVVGDQSRGLVRKLLANRLLLWVGMISYGVFLYQGVVIYQLHDWGFAGSGTPLRAPIWFLVATAGSCVLAAASWYALERPLNRLSHRRRAGVPASAPVVLPLESPAPGSAGEGP